MGVEQGFPGTFFKSCRQGDREMGVGRCKVVHTSHHRQGTRVGAECGNARTSATGKSSLKVYGRNHLGSNNSEFQTISNMW